VDLLAEELQQLMPDSPSVLDEMLADIRTQLVQDYLSLVRIGHMELTPQDLGAAVLSWAAEI
jgi:hypothetical protein